MAVGKVKAWSVFGEIGLTGLGNTTKQLHTFNAMGAAVGKNMLGLNKRALLVAGGVGALSLAVAALGVKSVGAFADFDAAMTQSLAIMGDVSTMMEGRMVEAAEAVARTTVFSNTQAAESYFYLASAGLSAEQSVAALPQVAAFAQAGMFDMARATDLATDAQSALGLTVKNSQENLQNLTRVTDVLVKANTLANASVEQFSTSLTSEAGAALKTVHKSIEEGVAVLAAFADQGVKAEKSGNALSRIIRIMNDAAVKHAGAYRELGIQVFDAGGNMRNFADILADMENAFAGMSDAQRTASLDALGFKARLQGAILPLIGTSQKIRDYEQALRGAGGTTQEVADKQLDTLRQQLKLTGDAFGVLLSHVGGLISEGGNLVGVVAAIRDGIVNVDTALRAAEPAFNLAGNALALFFQRAPTGHNPLVGAIEEAQAAAERAAESELRAADSVHERHLRAIDDLKAKLEAVKEYREFLQGSTIVDIGEPQVSSDELNPFIAGFADLMPAEDDMSWRAMIDPMESLGADMARRLGSAFNAEGPNIIPTMSEKYGQQLTTGLTMTLDDTSTEINPRVAQMGADLIQGLMDGSLSMEKFLTDTMISILSSSLLGPVAGFLGIASPSRVMMQMGRWTVEGYRLGLEAGAPNLQNTVRSIFATPLTASFSPTRAAQALVAGGGGPRLTLDLSGMPPARNPIEGARDRNWQDFFRDTYGVARKDGMRA